MSATPGTRSRARSSPAAGAGPRIRLAPVLLFILTWLGGSWSVLALLVAPVVPGGGWTLLAVALPVALPLTILARGFGGDAYPSAATRLLVLRPFWYAMLMVPLLAVAGAAGMAVGLPFGASAEFGRWSIAAFAVLLALVAGIGFAGTRRLAVRRLDVRHPSVPAAFDGFRIVQVSDLHVGPHTSRRFLARVAAAVRAARPDLIVLTGDQVDDFARDVEPFARAFGGLAAPLGVFAVPGNHDVIAGWAAVEAGLDRMGVTVLVNRAVPLERSGARVWLAGTGDPMARAWPKAGSARAIPDIDATLRGIPADGMAIALAHNPALWPALAERGVALTLSGHTHYGQLAIPRLGWSAASPFLDLAMGAHRAGGSLLYINPGTNYWGIPFRIGTRPEVTVLTLRRSLDGESGIDGL